eukprot:SAG11_NODE_1574_length_4659_cov_4.583333_6_plen_76_part_00
MHMRDQETAVLLRLTGQGSGDSSPLPRGALIRCCAQRSSGGRAGGRTGEEVLGHPVGVGPDFVVVCVQPVGEDVR